MRESLTPDFLHFIMCLGDDACHTLWVFGLWFTFKTFYVKPRESTSIPEALRVTVIYVQGILGLILASDLRLKTFIEFTACSAVLLARARYGKHLNLSLAFFMGIYLTQNFMVNCLDFMMFRKLHSDSLGYYHDQDFLKSFSYKTYQAFLCLLFALLFGQSFQPSHEAITISPSLLADLFHLTMPVSVMMLIAFLYELTGANADARASVYKTELMKVFFSVIHLYFLSMAFANWI